LDIDIVFECTGVFREKQALEKHLQAGARHVILSAPAKDDDILTVVHGVNESDEQARLVSCASCTTNCITPVAEIMARRIGVKKAIMTTIHAYTSTQAIVDGPNKKWKRGRGGASNFVPTTTGAAQATTKALPQYTNKFDGVAVRAPIPVGSIADIVFLAEKNTTVEEINTIFTEEAGTERYRNVLGVTEEPLVSSDIIGDPRASIVDLTMTQVVDGDMVKVMSWYDNEWGYANQMVREAGRMIRQSAPA
jgi:glyceraldehyde 3-phosphate dehydrogenase